MNENAKTVRMAYDRFAEGNLEGMLEIFSEDVNWKQPEINGASFFGPKKGREEVHTFFIKLKENEDFEIWEPKEFICEGEKVVVYGYAKAKIKTTGRKFESDWIHIFTVRDGRITDFVEQFDTVALSRSYQKSATA